MVKYFCRDCLEIFGIFLSEDYLMNDIVIVVGKVINVLVKEEDILIFYFFLFYNLDVLFKIIVKFICRDVCNVFYVN